MIGRNIGLALWAASTVVLCAIPVYIVSRAHHDRGRMLRDGELAFMIFCVIFAGLSLFSLIGWLISGGLGI